MFHIAYFSESDSEIAEHIETVQEQLVLDPEHSTMINE